MATKTTEWFCDSCSQVIKSASDGYFEWLTSGHGPGAKISGIRIVHHKTASPRPAGCQYDPQGSPGSNLADGSLSDFVGNDGLMLTLGLSADGANATELVQIVQRLFVPGYERARFHFQAAINAGVVQPNLAPGFHWQRDIDATLAWATKQGRHP